METKVIIKFIKYTLLTLGAVLVLALLGGAYYKMEEFISSSTSFVRVAALTALIVAGTLPSLICYSVSVAAFLAFRKVADKGIATFGKTLLAGLAIIIPLSAGIYFYDWNVQRAITKQAAIYMLEMRLSDFPQEIGEEPLFSDTDTDQMFADTPGMLSRARIHQVTDSLQTQYYELRDTCQQMLASLPDTMAMEAYRSYNLEELGVEYQYAAHPTANADSLEYVQNSLLYEQTLDLYGTSNTLTRYTFEYYKRNLSTWWLLVAYLLFAGAGYLLRYKPVKKVLAVVAVLILAMYAFQEITSYGKTYTKNIYRAANKMEKVYKWGNN